MLTLKDSKTFPTKKRFFRLSMADRIIIMVFCMWWSACSPLKLMSKSRYDLRDSETTKGYLEAEKENQR